MTIKRKNIFISKYEDDYPGVIKKSRKGEEFAHCVHCNDDINLTSIGKSAITQHFNSDKHKKSTKAVSQTKGIQAFAVNSSAPTNQDRQIAAAEGQ